MELNLIIDCPECGEEIASSMLDLTTDEPKVHISSIKDMEWGCENCNKRFCTGNIHILEI